jgi:peptidoglycan/LPS O-acetylase OafA/YrhL
MDELEPTTTERDRSGAPFPPAAAQTLRRLRHVPALDGIRGIGLVLVVATHALLIFAPGLYGHVLPGGFIGLDAFFVLSGFLITSLLLGEQGRNGRVSLRGFYRRRALRLLPALLCLLAVHAIYAAMTSLPMHTEYTSGLSVLLYSANWYRAAGHPVALGMGHLWSLAVEEQFYFVWPIVTVAVVSINRSARFVYISLVTGALVVCVWRYILWHHGVTPFVIQQRTDCRADSLIIGAIAAHIYVRRSLPRVRFSTLAWPALALLAYCALFLSAQREFWYVGGFTLVAIASALMILAIADGQWRGSAIFGFAPARTLGTVSYGIYLWHLPVFLAVRREMPRTTYWIQFALAAAITAGFTLVSWFGVERPAQRWKKGTRRTDPPEPRTTPDHDERTTRPVGPTRS